MKRLPARIVALSLLFAAYCTQSASAQTKQGDDAVQQLRKLNQVYRYLNAAYIDEVEMSPLVEKAIGAMLQELDPHSTYISPEEMKSVSIQLDGEFSGHRHRIPGASRHYRGNQHHNRRTRRRCGHSAE